MHTTPPLTEALFTDLLDPSKSPFDICHEHGLSLAELRAIATGDEFTELIAALHDIAQAREEAQRPELHRIARDSLALIAAQEPTSNTHAETVRRAAGALLRLKPDPIADDTNSPSTVTEGEAEGPPTTTTNPNEPRASARADIKCANTPAHNKSQSSHTQPLNSTSPPQPTAA